MPLEVACALLLDIILAESYVNKWIGFVRPYTTDVYAFVLINTLNLDKL